MLAEGTRKSVDQVCVRARLGEPDPHMLAAGRPGVSPQVRHSELGQLCSEPVRILKRNLVTVAAAIEVEAEQAKPLVRASEIDGPRILGQLCGDRDGGAVAVCSVRVDPDTSARRPQTSARVI